MSAKKLEPNITRIRKHLEFLFGHQAGETGLIQIFWTDAKTGVMAHSRLFAVDDINQAAGFAAKVNSVPGQNMFVGANLVEPLE